MSDNGFQCAADLLEAGMRIMDERGLKQCRDAIAQFDGTGKLCGVCAEGAMLLGMGKTIAFDISTTDAIDMIVQECPGVTIKSGLVGLNKFEPSIISIIPKMNDGSTGYGLAPHTLPEILAWLRARDPEAT